MNMTEKLEQEIINQYLLGDGCIIIANNLKISKPTVLKVLNKYNLIRKRDRCKSLNIVGDGEKYYIFWTCTECGCEIRKMATHRTILCRNYFRMKNFICGKCNAMGERNSFYGKKHTDKTKEMISKGRIGKGIGENNSMNNPEIRERLIKKIREKWANGEFEHLRKILSDKVKEARRLRKVKSVIVSKKEYEIIDELIKKGLEPIHSFRIDTKICDIFIPEFNLIIEYFGDYWHCNPKKYDADYFNVKKNKFAKEIWEYDRSKLELIKSYGYNLEVIWESDLKNNNKQLFSILEKYDKQNNSTP